MVYAKNFRLLVLGFLLVICLWFFIGGRVKAEDVDNSMVYGFYEYYNYYTEHTYKYYANLTNYDGFSFVQVYRTDACVYIPIVYVVEPDFQPSLIYDEISEEYDSSGDILSDKTAVRTFVYDNWGDFKSFTLADGRVCYFESFLNLFTSERSLDYSCCLTNRNVYNYDIWGNTLSNYQDVIENKALAGVKPDESDEVIPEWRRAEYKNFSLYGFTAAIADGAVAGEWKGVVPAAIATHEPSYVRLIFGLIPDGTVEGLSKKGIKYPDTYSFQDKGFTVSLEDLEIPEGYRLWYVSATPYYSVDTMAGDMQLYVGNASYVYFDEDGEASSAVEKVPDQEPEDVPDESFSIWESITNFFGSFFTNLLDMFKDAIVPSSEDLLQLLDEMNAWFSERFGFIWYPFDLAIQLVSAFAMGEADPMFKVPALTLNMFGGVTLWEEFETDLDAFGVLRYVRYFTSAVLAVSTVRLAINKFDEWIGGKKS